MKRDLVRDLLIAVGLAAATLLLYRKVTRLWWTYDDAYLLHLAFVHPARDHFFGGSLWQSMVQHLYTPLLTASYDSELSLFGLDAAKFFRVQLAELMLAAIALFAAMRLWLDRAAASAGALLFLLGAPVCNIVTELMLMHYIESILLGAVAVTLFALAVRRERWSLAIASAVVYLAAIMAKEVAVPLIVLVLLLPETDRRKRFVIPLAIALAIYAVLRWMALGTFFGGYGWVVSAADIPRLIFLTPLRTLGVFAGPKKIAGALLLVVTGAAIVMSWRSKRMVWTSLAALALAIAPTLPIAKEMQTRFAFVPWLCWSVLFAVAMRNRRMIIFAAAAVLLAIVVNRQAWSGEFATSLRMSDEARVFFDLGPNDLLRTPKVPPGSMGELRWLKEEYEHRPRGAGWFYDDIYLCDMPLGGRRMFEYVTAKRAVVDATAGADQRARQFCAAIRGNVPLSVAFRYRGDSLSWELGPYHEGNYTVVIADGLQAFTVPRVEAFHMSGIDKLPVRVRYDAPAGWTTYSPPLMLDLSKESDLQWRR